MTDVSRVNAVALALVHLADTAGDHPADASMALTLALANSMGNAVDLSDPENEGNMIGFVQKELARIFAQVVLGCRMVEAAGETKQ